MEYDNVEFNAIVATPGCGKSYVCDRYPEIFVDVDEERLRCKYIVPDNVTREELEATKGSRTFERRAKHDEYIKNLYLKLDKFVKEGKILIAAPHPEAIDYFVNNNIKFCFVFPAYNMKEEVKNRMIKRGNPPQTVKENDDLFYTFYESNNKENKSVIHYEFGKDEYLLDILKKFGCEF